MSLYLSLTRGRAAAVHCVGGAADDSSLDTTEVNIAVGVRWEAVMEPPLPHPHHRLIKVEECDPHGSLDLIRSSILKVSLMVVGDEMTDTSHESKCLLFFLDPHFQ